MTPQLMQAIKLLQLSNLDLAAYVDGELERNPLLERAGEGEPAAEPSADRRCRRARRRQAAATAPSGDWIDERSRDQPQRRSRTGSTPTSTTSFPTTPSRRRRAASATSSLRPIPNGPASAPAAREDGDYNLEAFVSAETTLADHLAEQLALAIADPARRMIGQYLIDLVDEAGYLTGDLATVAEKLGAPLAEVEAVLAILQSFDPPGVCARNLTECLAIQLKERDRFDPAMQALVGHLDLLAKRDFAALRQHLRRRRRRSRRHDRRDPRAQSEARPRLRLDPGAADRARRVRAAGAGRRLDRRAQFRHAAEGAGQPDLYTPSVARRRRTTATRPISPSACRPRPG